MPAFIMQEHIDNMIEQVSLWRSFQQTSKDLVLFDSAMEQVYQVGWYISIDFSLMLVADLKAGPLIPSSTDH
jgi:hypothetical protein